MLTDVESKLRSLQLSRTMAEGAGAQAPPTFKLVLVGDGGTGKVSSLECSALVKTMAASGPGGKAVTANILIHRQLLSSAI